MRSNKIIFIVFLFCYFPLYTFPQFEKTEFDFYTKKDGLSHNYVTALTQDRYGYIWIGTEYGLNRFDGLNFKQFFSSAEKESLPSDEIKWLRWIDSNHLAVLTNLGINIINIETMKQENLLVPAGELIEANRVNSNRGMLTDKSGNHFVATRTGFYHFDKNKEMVFRYDDYTRKQLESGGGAFGVFLGWLDEDNLIVTGQKGAYQYTVSSKKFIKNSGLDKSFSLFKILNELGERNFTIRQPQPGTFILFIADSDTAIYINESKKILTPSRLAILPLSDEINWRSNLFVLKDSSFLLSGKNSGLFRLSLDRETGKLLLENKKDFNSQKHNDLLVDHNNHMWVGTSNGLYREKRNAVNLRVFSMPDSIGLVNPISSILQMVADENYLYAAGGAIGGFCIFNKHNLRFERKVTIPFPSKREHSVYSIIKRGMDTVLCGGTAGLYWYDLKSRAGGFYHLTGWDPAHSWISNIFEDSYKNIWITGSDVNGYYFRENNSGEFKWKSFNQLLSKSIHIIWRMAEDSRGNIWMAGSGLVRYNRTNGSFDEFIDSFPAIRMHTKGVNALEVDKSDNLWFGNATNGLIYFEHDTKKFTSFTRSEGLPDNSVKALNITGNKVWIACKTGIAGMDLITRKIYSQTNSKELLYNDISANKLFYDSAANMMYSAIGRHLISFNTDTSADSEEKPRLLIENISISNDSVIWNPGSAFYTKWKNKNITVTFNCINYHDPQDQRYAYRVVNGKSEEWIQMEEQRRIVFSDLQSGSHRFELKVFSKNNRWPAQYLSFTIIISPPFWKTWWFTLVSIVVVSSVIFFIFWYRVNQLKKIIKIRSKISQDLHDEVGATLSGIAMYSHLTRDQIKKQQTNEVEKSLSIIEHSAGEMVNKLNDIVWVVNPQHDSMQKLILKLEEYALEMAVAKGIKVQSDIQEKITDIKLPMETRRNIFLICKEAINNAVKYSQATILEIMIHAFDHSIEITVKDNGKGFDLYSVKKGNGVENMQKRADEIGAKLILLSKQNEGTSVSLHYRIT